MAGLRADKAFRWLLLVALVVTPVLGSRAEDPPGSQTATLEAILEGGVPQNLEQLREMERQQQLVVERATPCTVGLQIGPAQGSGVIVSEDGYILTAAHVAQRPGLRVLVILEDGRRVQGTTLGLDRSTDAGMVKIDGPPDDQGGKWPHLELAGDDVSVGQWTMVTGHPGGFQPGRKPVVRLGRVLSRSGELIVTDGTLVGGDSGGPLLDLKGQVVGIHSRIGGPLTANMHVPVRIYRENWDRMVAGEMWGDVPRGSPYIGVQGDPEAKEARIVRVEPGQPGDRAGLRAGDVVLKFGDTEVQDFATLAALVADAEPGTKVPLEIRRGEETKVLELVIGRRN